MTVLTTGTLVDGRYRIERKLGEGGMGAVFLAHDLVLERAVAIKHLLPAYATDAEAVGRFAREAAAAVNLSCEHSVRVYGVGQLEGAIPFIVMEYLEGRDLGAVIAAEGRLAPKRAVALVLQALEGLAEAHALGIVHRDIKPQNLFVTYSLAREEVVKLLDFGLAKAPTGAGETKLTKTAACMGSPAYMAPEQIREFATVDSRADIYAIGCCLYELLTGRAPFDADNVADILVQALIAKPLAPSAVRADISPALSSVVLRCLEKDAAQRFTDVGALARALHDAALLDARSSRARVDRILARHGVPTQPESSNVEGPRIARRTGRLGAAALAALVLVGAGATWGAHRYRAASIPRPHVVEAAVLARAPAPAFPETIAREAPPSEAAVAEARAIELEPTPRARTGAKPARAPRRGAKASVIASAAPPPPRDPGSHY